MGQFPESAGRHPGYFFECRLEMRLGGKTKLHGSIRDLVSCGKAAVQAEHVFAKLGTYFPVVKVAANRTSGDPFTRVWNQDRVRVVVE